MFGKRRCASPSRLPNATDYQDKRVPKLYDLEEIALPIEIKGRSAGFANATKENGSRAAGFIPGEAASLQEQDED